MNGIPPGEDGGGSGSGKLCGGFGGGLCGPDEFCDFARNGCGAADEAGTCQPRPFGCPDTVFEPTCGCDGTVYGSACDAAAAGTDVNANGTCKLEPGAFACGFTQCNLMTEYCQRAASDIGNEPDSFRCMPLPACPSQFPTCSCLANEPCGFQCAGDAATGLTLTCPGG